MLATKASMRDCWSETEMQGPKFGQFFFICFIRITFEDVRLN